MSVALPSAEALGVRFRSVQDEDLPFLCRLYAATRADEVAQTGWPVEVQARFLADQFELQRQHWDRFMPNAEKMVIERDGAPIGRLYIDESSDQFHVVDIALLPDSRGSGIGGAVFADLMRLAAETARSVSIYVEKNNPALSLYRRLGFIHERDEGVYDYMEWRPQSI